MKTESYNPSVLEVEFTKVISSLKQEMEAGLSSNRIVEIQPSLEMDNPTILIQTEDEDGDRHELVLKIIQRPDKF